MRHELTNYFKNVKKLDVVLDHNEQIRRDRHPVSENFQNKGDKILREDD